MGAFAKEMRRLPSNIIIIKWGKAAHVSWGANFDQISGCTCRVVESADADLAQLNTRNQAPDNDDSHVGR